MKISQVEGIPSAFGLTRGGVATIGVFDGVHRGHQKILARLRERARAAGTPAIVLTFAVHPVVVLRGLAPRLITSLPHRLRLFAAAGIDECAVLPFDKRIAALPAEEFARLVFVDELALQALVVGPDARIGAGRRGDTAFLAGYLAARGIAFEVVDDCLVGDQRISSTQIRAAIADGDLARAQHLLGRPWSLLGTVVRGQGRGRELGFRTANLDLKHEIRPPPGVYAVRALVGGEGGTALEANGVANVGIRPTFGPDGDLTVEAHLLDFNDDLYGRTVELIPLRRIRPERTFGSREELAAQIRKDVETARAVFL